MGEDSPLGESQSNTSNRLSDNTDEKIPDAKTKAGMSNELHSMVVTPTKDMSPDTIDQRLALHCVTLHLQLWGTLSSKNLSMNAYRQWS